MRASLVQELCVKVCCQPVSTVFMQSKDFNFHFLQLLYNANKARPSKQCEFSNYIYDKSSTSQGCPSGSIGQSGPGGLVIQVVQVVQVVQLV